MGSMATRKLLLIIVFMFKDFFGGDFITLLFYVDDILIVCYNASRIAMLKDLGPTKQVLGIRLTHDREAKSYGYHKRGALRKYFKVLIWIELRW